MRFENVAQSAKVSGRLLLLGEEVSDFTLDISEATRAVGIRVDVLELRGLPPRRRNAYDSVVDPPKLAVRAHRSVAILNAIAKAGFWRDLATRISAEPAPRAGACIRQAVRTSLAASWAQPVLRCYDIVNIHMVSPNAMLYLPLVPEGTQVVVSFWGSDLYKLGAVEYSSQRRALERADLITVHSAEMRQVLFAKFGSHLASKVRTLLFGVSATIINQIDERNTRQARAEFKRSYSICEDDIVIAVGYCGAAAQNHAEVIREIGSLPNETKQRIVIVLAMTYGHAYEGYPDDMHKLASSLGLRAVLFKSQLAIHDLADLRNAVDIVVHLPESDAMSSSFVEALWAGSVAIVGCWLPYARLRVAGTYFRELSQIEQLTEALVSIIEELPIHRDLASKNRDRLGFLLSTEQAKLWTNLYLELLERRSTI